MDKKSWGEGPWMIEPDKHEFEYKGYKCVLNRSIASGSWCGYVRFPKNAMTMDLWALDIHGSVTWCKNRLPWEEENEDGEYFWVGFDCAHLGDYWPALAKEIKEIRHIAKKFDTKSPLRASLLDSEYRTMDFAVNELKHLINQVEERQEKR